ncbi:MAG TPA: 16S rRNA (cytosine(1402)-N(4))-methyltransferase, partial [Myxococcaceae bacterium]|nr:16S rRNA (cytosine(1402)-N(4))-methyltransferase [Myxococcaceae bacterium]
MPFVHEPVLLPEAVSLLEPGAGKVIVDGTLGGGGHSEALLKAGAEVLGVDRDPRALAAAQERLAGYGSRFRAVKGNFGEV